MYLWCVSTPCLLLVHLRNRRHVPQQKTQNPCAQSKSCCQCSIGAKKTFDAMVTMALLFGDGTGTRCSSQQTTATKGTRTVGGLSLLGRHGLSIFLVMIIWAPLSWLEDTGRLAQRQQGRFIHFCIYYEHCFTRLTCLTVRMSWWRGNTQATDTLLKRVYSQVPLNTPKWACARPERPHGRQMQRKLSTCWILFVCN